MVLVFGATGFTGRLAVAELVARGVPVRLAGRSPERLENLSAKHGGLEWVVADVKDPASIGKAAEGASVLVSTVGPYTWWGHIAAEAAIEHGIPYFDITGEPGFVRKIFEEHGPRAAAAGVPMLTAFGYDYVPGNLAGALALEAAGDGARSVDIGYFLTGQTSRSLKSFSAGTLRSLRASSSEMQFGYRGGKIIDERGARRVLKFDLGGKSATAISIGSTEALSLPRLHPELREVNVGLGWFGPASRAVSVFSGIGEQVEKIPGVRSVLDRVIGSAKPQTTKQREKPAGPDDAAREQARTDVIAIVRDGYGNELASVRVNGPNPYDVTGKLIGWAAEKAAAGEINGVGALGPAEAFGVEGLRAGCESIGLKEV